MRTPIECISQPSEREAPKAWCSRHTPEQFDAVVGQSEVVQALSARIRTNKRSGHVVLYGPPGVGKLTVARIYRRALHCEWPTVSGAACLGCENCRDLNGSWAAQLIDFDPRDHGGVEVAHHLVRTVRHGFRSDKERVIIVRNVEAFEDAATDALLKVMEFDAAHTNFVVTTTNINKLRSPVRSRCQAYLLRPLSRTQAKERLIQLCEQENVVYDPVALEIIAAHAGNRAGDLLHRLCKVASGGTATVARVKEIFGLEWTNAILNYWRSLLARNEKESLSAFAGVGENTEDRIERLRASSICSGRLEVTGRRPPIWSWTPPWWTCRVISMVSFLRAWVNEHASVTQAWTRYGPRSLNSGPIVIRKMGSGCINIFYNFIDWLTLEHRTGDGRPIDKKIGPRS